MSGRGKNRIPRLLSLALCALLCAGLLSGAATAAAEETEAGPSLDERMAEAKKEIRTSSVGRYGMLPVYGRDVVDGVYPITVDSSSPFFKIIGAELTVSGGEMTAKITISSTSYLYLYPGTGQDAARADKSEWTGALSEAGGHSVFQFDLEALNKPLDCASYSRRRKKWYNRTIVFDASSLPAESLLVDLPDYEVIEKAISAYVSPAQQREDVPHETPEAVSVPYDDGEYSIEVNMTGGSGRASISSPTILVVRDGKAYAHLIWSSAYYDYMVLQDEVYHNLTTDGGSSTFEIPITVMDEGIPVIADTTAMGDPVEIEYVLTFYSESIGDRGLVPQEAAKKVLLIAGAIIAAGAIPNYYIKKKRK